MMLSKGLSVPSSRLALIALLCSIAYPTFAQETANNKESSILTDPENGHIKLFRYTIAPHDELVLPKLSHESVVICFECEQIKRTPGQGAAEVWDASPGRAIWNHSNTSYWFLNESDISAKIVVVEVKDYFKFDETRVPSTDYDPVLIDSRHYQILFENDGVRLLRLRLGPREETQDVQLPLHLQIALSDVHANIVPTVGKVKEERNAAGTAAWKRDELRSVVNLSDQALDEVLLEWKSPFCYSSNSGWELMKDADDPTKKYVEKVFEATRKIWFKEAGKIAREGKKGLVVLSFKIQKNGTIGEEDIRPTRVFATGKMLGAVTGVVRSLRLDPLPAGFKKDAMDFRFSFAYNLTPRPAGCEDSDSEVPPKDE